MTSRTRGPLRALGRVSAAAALVALAAGCTGGEPSGSPDEPPPRSVGEQPTLKAKPVPVEVTVAKVVGGHLRREQRQQLEKQVGRLLSGYFDDAFLGGRYPREDFSGALATFSPGAASRAAGQRGLLTNAEVGAATSAVVARTKQARLDVLVPGRHVIGLTARVRLVFLRRSTDGAEQRVTVSGRLLVNRKNSGPWQIFGYDLARSAVPTANGGSR